MDQKAQEKNGPVEKKVYVEPELKRAGTIQGITEGQAPTVTTPTATPL